MLPRPIPSTDPPRRLGGLWGPEAAGRWRRGHAGRV